MFFVGDEIKILNGSLMYMGEAQLVGLGTNRSLAGSHKSFTRLTTFILFQIETKIGSKERIKTVLIIQQACKP